MLLVVHLRLDTNRYIRTASERSNLFSTKSSSEMDRIAVSAVLVCVFSLAAGYSFHCSNLANPAHGYCSISGYKAVYTCHSGYRLSSSAVRYCRSGTWHGVAPRCLSGTADIPSYLAILKTICVCSRSRVFPADGSAQRPRPCFWQASNLHMPQWTQAVRS